MTLGLDAMEEGYVKAIQTLIDIYYTTDDNNMSDHISSAYIESLEETLKELRPPVVEVDPAFIEHKKYHTTTNFSMPNCKYCKKENP